MKSGNLLDSKWSSLFSTVVWLVWLRRNERVFENKIMCNAAIVIKARSILEVISKFKFRLKGVNLNGCVVVNREER